VSSGNSTSWEDCPEDFVDKLKVLINRGDTLLNASMGCDGDWFLRTNQSICWKASSADFVSQTVQAYEHAEKHNIDLPYGQIISVTFVPNSNGCICIGQASDGTTTCLWRGDGVPPSLAEFLGDVPRTNPVQSVSVGSDYGWVVVLQNGAVYSNGISDNLKQKLQSASGVLSVLLSLSNPEEYLINYANGGNDCRLESRWLAAVSAETQRCVLQRQSLYSAASNLGNAALSAQIMINRSQAAGAAAVLDAIW